MKGRILLIEDEENFRVFLQTVLADAGYSVLTAANGIDGLKLLKSEQVDLAISDLKLPGISGTELFRKAMEETSPPLFIFLTAFGTVEEAVNAMKDGAFDFLTKPLKDMESLLALVARALESKPRIRGCLTCVETETARLPPAEIIFAGRAIQTAHTLVHNVAPTLANVLITGESGTGKEVIAKVIHLLSQRNSGPFIAINCAAIPENLLESELFGHEKGAFTGAHQARQGKFELAHGGSIFLDEIGDMPLPLQSKLLRVLQEKCFERVGGTKVVTSDVRVIAATNRDLDNDIIGKRFREDLYYRLNVFPIKLPPLRERQEILTQLTEYFLQSFNQQLNKNIKGIEPEAMKRINAYAWPGNIRELKNVMERAVILSTHKIEARNLPDQILHMTVPEQHADGRQQLKSLEKELIVQALKRHDGNRRLAADELKISRRTLQYKLKEFELLNE